LKAHLLKSSEDLELGNKRCRRSRNRISIKEEVENRSVKTKINGRKDLDFMQAAKLRDDIKILQGQLN
jgi:protein-arginine kinase activator protein McsA